MKRWSRWLVVGCAAVLVGACILSPVEDLPSSRGIGNGNNGPENPNPSTGSGGDTGLGVSPPDGDSAAGAAGTAFTVQAGAPSK